MDFKQSLTVDPLVKTSSRQFVVNVAAALMLRLSVLTRKSTFQRVDAFFVFACGFVAVDKLEAPSFLPATAGGRSPVLLVVTSLCKGPRLRLSVERPRAPSRSQIEQQAANSESPRNRSSPNVSPADARGHFRSRSTCIPIES